MRVPGALPLFSQEVQRAAANSGWLLADRLVRGGGSLVLMVLIGRWLGPRSFGLYSYALAMTALFAPIASLGLEGIVVRNLVLNPEKSGKTLTEALFLRILGGLTALALLFPTLLLQRGERREALVIVLLLGGAYLFQAWDVLDHWFQSRVQSRYAAWVRMPVFLLGGTLKGFLAYRGGSLVLLAGVALLEALAGALGLWLVYRFLHGPALFSEFSLSGAGALLRDSWPLVLSGILVLSFLKIDQVMLGTMASMSALGIYASAVRLVELWNLLPQVVLPSVYPTLVKRRGEDPGSYRRTLQRLFSLFAGFSLVAVAVNVGTSLTAVTPMIELTLRPRRPAGDRTRPRGRSRRAPARSTPRPSPRTAWSHRCRARRPRHRLHPRPRRHPRVARRPRRVPCHAWPVAASPSSRCAT